MIEPTVRQILPGTDMVGESIVWDLERGCMFWVDIVGRAIRRFDPVSGHEQRWEAPELPTSIGLRTDGGAIVGLTRRVALWDFGETFETLAIPEPDLPDNRLNEGKVAPDGSFWVGTMQNNVTESGTSKDTPARPAATTESTPRAGQRCYRRIPTALPTAWRGCLTAGSSLPPGGRAAIGRRCRPYRHKWYSRACRLAGRFRGAFRMAAAWMRRAACGPAG
jgi:hypothetical protein